MKPLLWNCITLIAGTLAALSITVYILAAAAFPFVVIYKLIWG